MCWGCEGSNACISFFKADDGSLVLCVSVLGAFWVALILWCFFFASLRASLSAQGAPTLANGTSGTAAEADGMAKIEALRKWGFHKGLISEVAGGSFFNHICFNRFSPQSGKNHPV